MDHSSRSSISSMRCRPLRPRRRTMDLPGLLLLKLPPREEEPEEDEKIPRVSRWALSQTFSAPTPAGKGVALTAEMIDLIADKVVERLADRVVREIAWEVVPGVAETLVRRRIKELEDSHSG